MTVRGVLANDHQPDGRTRHPDRHGNCPRHPLYVSFAAEVLSSPVAVAGKKTRALDRATAPLLRSLSPGVERYLWTLTRQSLVRTGLAAGGSRIRTFPSHLNEMAALRRKRRRRGLLVHVLADRQSHSQEPARGEQGSV
jgi:hypothetical protein